MKILYLGDSITEAGKNINNGGMIPIGQGYALLTSARLLMDHPGEFSFVNSGIACHRVVDLYARVKADVWNHAPDVVSILVGINDVRYELMGNNGVEADRFERVLTMLVQETQERLPNAKILLMEPFTLRVGEPSNWELFRTEVGKRASAVSRVAEACGTAFFPLQDLFDQACRRMPADYWLIDGVHPTSAGHQLIADAWLKLFRSEILPQ